MNRDLKQRTFDFALNVAKLAAALPGKRINRLYFGQLIRSSSSVGANYRASQRAKSDKDFINKLKIVEEEADESIFFLQLLQKVNETYSDVIQPLIKEGIEILSMIVSSIKTKRANMNSVRR